MCLLRVLSPGLILLGMTDDRRVLMAGLLVILAAIFDPYRSRIIASLRARQG